MIFEEKSKALVMAVINLTPDSFYEDSRVTADRAVEAALKAVADGADILDLGAQSTAPGSTEITAEEELARLIAPLKEIRKAVNVPISVDTFYPIVAGQALENGADIINDVSGKADPEMAQLAAKHNAGWVVMHTGNLHSSQEGKYEKGVINDINLFFEKAIETAKQAGLTKENLCLDPGIGFGKSREDDLEIVSRFAEFQKHGCVTMAALSRKRVTRLCGDALTGTIALNTACILCGAGIIRVHDADKAAAQVKMLSLIKGDKALG